MDAFGISRKRGGVDGEQCLISLPSDLQLKIFEYLSAVDIAMVGCVCKELQIMAADDELWKKKCEDEFGEYWKRECERWKDTFNRVSSYFTLTFAWSTLFMEV
ncbi:hypothetical protein SUGI_0238610 [Cryptomeria japonica]|nr:hypothetical protein SUGI_0238610 [Cryptomeria japonica]